MQDLMDWLGDVFYVDRTETVTKEGYTTERWSYSGSVQTVQLPYEETMTTTSKAFNWQAGAAFVLVVLTFVTVVTAVRSALLK
nr:MAG TPA: hypothetical protein [Inoviridae sp.]